MYILRSWASNYVDRYQNPISKTRAFHNHNTGFYGSSENAMHVFYWEQYGMEFEWKTLHLITSIDKTLSVWVWIQLYTVGLQYSTANTVQCLKNKNEVRWAQIGTNTCTYVFLLSTIIWKQVQTPEADLRKRTLSAASGWGTSAAKKFYFGWPKINPSVLVGPFKYLNWFWCAGATFPF